MSQELQDSLAEYVNALSAGLASTAHAEDRLTYTKHLAASAQMFATLHFDDVQAFRRILEDEERSFGWGFLSGQEGQLAESTFHKLLELARRSTKS